MYMKGCGRREVCEPQAFRVLERGTLPNYAQSWLSISNFIRSCIALLVSGLCTFVRPKINAQRFNFMTLVIQGF